ncbi:MAG: TlpA disulfide reductase family protein [Saprospiraceae bacterium]
MPNTLMEIKYFLLIFLSIYTCTLLIGQTKYLQSPNGQILDTVEFAKLKESKMSQMKQMMPGIEIHVGIVEDLYEIRRSPDSIIYTYKLDFKIVNVKADSTMSFKPDHLMNKVFPMPIFRTLAGENMGIKDLRGKPSLINFWSATCQPCIDQMPGLNEIKHHLKDSVNFVAFNSESNEIATWFLERNLFDFTHITNVQDFLNSLNLMTIPLNIFLDKEGIVRKIERGFPHVTMDDGTKIIGDGKEFIVHLRELLSSDDKPNLSDPTK